MELNIPPNTSTPSFLDTRNGTIFLRFLYFLAFQHDKIRCILSHDPTHAPTNADDDEPEPGPFCEAVEAAEC